ncbi:MAG: tetratricopeptide repeat protein [Bryobacteraceae bacterium]
MSRTQGAAKDTKQAVFISIGVIAVVLAAVFVFRVKGPRLPRSHTLAVQSKTPLEARPTAADDASSANTIRFLLGRVKRDPDDFVVQSMLSSSLLQKVRETGNADYLGRAARAAQASLLSVPAERNAGGLSALARTEMAAHDFVKAREDGLRLTQIHPGMINSWGVLTDALLELGDYAKADAAIQQMRKLGSDTAETEIRVGRLLFLQGDTAGAQKHFFRALAFALNVSPPPREVVAWCRWQLGEMAFSSGGYESAERYYREALVTYPGYVQALASLARVRAARADLAGAIQRYEEAVRRFPDPTFVAALGDLYHLTGREKEAQTQYELVEQIGHLNALNGTRYNRQIAVFYADHGRKADEAYNDAAREYADRRDVYGADTLAWAAMKAGRVADAQKAIAAALRLSTRDAKLFYHAGMIARASGNGLLSRDYLRRALALNPCFDPLQAIAARKGLEN